MESYFQISISFLNYCPKTEKYTNRVNIDQSAMYCLSMDLTIYKLYKQMEFFFQITESFSDQATIFKNNSDVRLMHARRGRHL